MLCNKLKFSQTFWESNVYFENALLIIGRNVLFLIQVINLRRIIWAEHVALMGDRRSVQRILVGKTEGKRPLENLAIDGKIILKWIFKKWMGMRGLD